MLPLVILKLFLRHSSQSVSTSLATSYFVSPSSRQGRPERCFLPPYIGSEFFLGWRPLNRQAWAPQSLVRRAGHPLGERQWAAGILITPNPVTPPGVNSCLFPPSPPEVIRSPGISDTAGYPRSWGPAPDRSQIPSALFCGGRL